MEKAIPILFKEKSLCCGCSACYSICPQNAIVMAEDGEGFEYPFINESRCIKCLKCLLACPMPKS